MSQRNESVPMHMRTALETQISTVLKSRECASRDAWGAVRVPEAGESGLAAREGGSPDSVVLAANSGDCKPWPGAVSRWLAAATKIGMGTGKSE
jgi:hypothetical protein